MVNTLPKILIHEYCSGGGWDEPDLAAGLASEGLAMLVAVLDDFRDWGKAEIYTTVDKRISGILLSGDNVRRIESSDYARHIEQLAEECEYAVLIAPESKGILTGLSHLLLNNDVILLGSDPEAISTTGDKWECYRVLRSSGVPVPETIRTENEDAESLAEKMGYPLIVKPIDGAGCEGVNLVKNMDALRAVLKNDAACRGEILLQEYIRGEHLSVSVLSTGEDFVCLSLNRQHINEGVPFEYRGGEVMPPPVEGDELYNIIAKIMELIPGLKGYVGADLIRNETGYKIIEINPRLTTSYTGIRKVININLAGAIWEAVIEGKLPQSTRIAGNTVFNKELHGTWN